MKKIILMIVALLLSFPLMGQAGHSSRYDVCEKDYTPVHNQPLDSNVYEVIHCGKGVRNIIVGTMHASDKEVHDSVRHALPELSSADVAWFEIVQTLYDKNTTMRRITLAPNKPRLRETIGRERFSQIIALMKTHMPDVPASHVNNLRPWAIAVMLQTVAVSTEGTVLDDWLQDYAKKQDVPVKALETTDLQLDVFDKLPHDKQITLLDATLTEFDNIFTESEKMQTLYTDGKLSALADMASFDMIEDKELQEYLTKTMIVDRNHQMVIKLEPSFAKGGAFVAVGALHLTGDTGLLKAFEGRGYIISPLYKR